MSNIWWTTTLIPVQPCVHSIKFPRSKFVAQRKNVCKQSPHGTFLVQKLLVCFYNPVLHFWLCLGCVEKKYCVCCVKFCKLFVSWLWLHLRSDSRRQHRFHRRTGRKGRSEIITAFAFFFSPFVCCCLLCFSKYSLNSRHYALLCSFFASADVLYCVASKATNWTHLYFKLEHFFFFFLERSSIHPSSTPIFTQTHGRRGRKEFKIKKIKTKTKGEVKHQRHLAQIYFALFTRPQHKAFFFFFILLEKRVES